MSVAVVLGAGGLVGQAFHLGALMALMDGAGFDARDASVLVGTSAGSLVAAGLAGGLSAHELAAHVLGRPAPDPRQPAPALDPGLPMPRQGRRISRDLPLRLPDQPAPTPGRGPLSPGALLAAARHPLTTRPGALAAALLPAGARSTDPVARGVRRLHPSGWPDRDLRICAVRARDARRVVFTGDGEGPDDLGTAVAASCAIPGWFAPVRSGGETYVDGGAHSPSNADVVLADRPDLVVIISPMSAERPALRADLGLRLAVRSYLAAEVVRLRRAGSRVVVLQPGPGDLQVMGSNPMRGDGLGAIVDRAAASTRKRLEGDLHLLG